MTKVKSHSGTTDEAIEYFVLHGCSQRAAADKTDCCVVALGRAITALKEGGSWDEHVMDIHGRAKQPAVGQKRELDMPTPTSLGKQIKAGTNRLGDGRPYGGKGNTWGEYREGHKIATSAIATAGVSKPNAQAASSRLAAAGVSIGKTTLLEAAKAAPGKTPVKMGDQALKLPRSFIEAGRKVVQEMRELTVPNLKCMVKAELNAMIRGTKYESLLPDGVTDKVYYNFLDRSDLYSNDTRPLEDDRLLWRHSENSRRQYMVWAETFVDAKLAVFAPAFASAPEAYFDSAEPYSELILWLPGAEQHVASLDETDVAADETTRGKSAAQRSVLVADAGSRRGHGAAGRGGGKAGSRVGWVKSRKERAAEPVRDSGECAAAKGGSKFTFVGTDLMSGDACETLILSTKSVETLAKKIDLAAVSPESTLVDPTSGARRKARFIQTDSGGVELSTMTTLLNDILLPSFPSHGDDAEARLSRAPTVADPDDVVCWDGLKQHHSLEFIRPARAMRVRSLLRYSHGSQDNQHEDFENFSYFKPAFGAEKMKLRTDKVLAAKATADAEKRPISAQERIAAGKLSDGDVLRCAKGPWEEAFSNERVRAGWQQEGIYPKFNCALFWRLRATEAKKEVVGASRLPVGPDEEWLRKFNAPHSSAASINCDANVFDEKEMQAEVDRRVQARLNGAPAPEKLPGVGAGNLFKLKGSASGEQAGHVIREKEIERLVDEKLKEHRKDDRDTKKDEKLGEHFTHAAEGLALYSTSGMAALNVNQLKGILSVHSLKPTGNKPDLQKQLRGLLDEKMKKGAGEAAVVEEMRRLTVAAAAAREVNDRPLAMPMPAEGPELAPLLLHGPEA